MFRSSLFLLLCMERRFWSDLWLSCQASQHCLSVDFDRLRFWARVFFLFLLLELLTWNIQSCPVHSTADSGITHQRAVTTVLGREHILHLWLLRGCVFSWNWGPPACDLAVLGGILLCVPPVELGLEEIALQSFLVHLRYCSLQVFLWMLRLAVHCRSVLCSVGGSQLGFSKEFILFLRFLYCFCVFILCCACRISQLRKK